MYNLSCLMFKLFYHLSLFTYFRVGSRWHSLIDEPPCVLVYDPIVAQKFNKSESHLSEEADSSHIFLVDQMVSTYVMIILESSWMP